MSPGYINHDVDYAVIDGLFSTMKSSVTCFISAAKWYNVYAVYSNKFSIWKVHALTTGNSAAFTQIIRKNMSIWNHEYSYQATSLKDVRAPSHGTSPIHQYHSGSPHWHYDYPRPVLPSWRFWVNTSRNLLRSDDTTQQCKAQQKYVHNFWNASQWCRISSKLLKSQETDHSYT